jgi:quinol monooxygenase YgiN
MIVVNAIIESTESDIENLRAALVAMEAASRAEQGCLDYTFSVEVNDSSRLRITECWEHLEALQAHFKTAHMASFQSAVAAHPPKNLDVKFFEAQEIPSPFG